MLLIFFVAIGFAIHWLFGVFVLVFVLGPVVWATIQLGTMKSGGARDIVEKWKELRAERAAEAVTGARQMWTTEKFDTHAEAVAHRGLTWKPG